MDTEKKIINCLPDDSPQISEESDDYNSYDDSYYVSDSDDNNDNNQ